MKAIWILPAALIAAFIFVLSGCAQVADVTQKTVLAFEKQQQSMR